MVTPTFRPGTPDDTRAIYDVFVQSIGDFERRGGTSDGDNVWFDPGWVARFWERRGPLFDHLARTAEGCWIAERDGQVIGYARATLHDGVRELTEFFVLPGHQAGGVGCELLARAFPHGGARRRVIIATTDTPALARYLKAGVSPRFPIYSISGKPHPADIPTDLTIERATATPETFAELRAIDQAILGFARDTDHAFLLSDRRAELYRRGDQVVGYGYVGNGTGPIALLEVSDVPAVLARAETEAARRHEADFGLNVPLVNRAAVDHLLRRGFRLDGTFPMFFMSDEAFGAFEHYIVSSPPFFL
ncbi:MAG: GNAT family N-acetyltransferase [Chloroflexota bacterium]|nr:GNAT family N-acetyltransferase [Chloroflexota bacterium]